MSRSENDRPDARNGHFANIAFFPTFRNEADPQARRYDDMMRRFFLARAAEMDEDGEPGEDPGELATQLIMTPAPDRRHLTFKLTLFAEELAIEADAGVPPMARTMALYAALQADVLRIMAEDGPREG
jgi:hypothetical protein